MAAALAVGKACGAAAVAPTCPSPGPAHDGTDGGRDGWAVGACGGAVVAGSRAETPVAGRQDGKAADGDDGGADAGAGGGVGGAAEDSNAGSRG